MKLALFKGLDEDQIREVKSAFLGAKVLRNRLKKVLEDKIDSTRRRTINIKAYDNPNWALIQADAMGEERAMRILISLLEDEEFKEK